VGAKLPRSEREKTMGTLMPAMSEKKVCTTQVLSNISKFQKERYVSRSKVELGFHRS
jgi:hypothetical protein